MTIKSEYLKRVRVFIASPRDLIAERKMFRDAIGRVNTIKAESYGILFKAGGWEDTLPGKGRPQEKINEDIKKSDLIVMLLWKRWGSSTGKYSSGFEEEYEVACTHEKDIWLYFRDIPEDKIKDPDEQLEKVLEFRKKIETEKKFLFREYKDESAWKEQFVDDLCLWLDEMPGTFGLENFTEVPKRHLQSSLGTATISLPIAVAPIGSAQLLSYKWDSMNFEGFCYDLKDGLGAEQLIIKSADGRTIRQDDLIYTTRGQEKTLNVVKYAFNNNYPVAAMAGLEKFGVFDMSANAGQYNIVGWQAQSYVGIKNRPYKHAKLLLEQGNDASEKKTLTIGETWDIGGGWTLTANSIDAKASPRQVWLTLSKDGVKKDDKVVAQGNVYTYVEKRIGGESDVPLFVTYVDSIFAGETNDIVQLRYTWAIDTSIIEIKGGDKFGVFTVQSIDPVIQLRNTYVPIVLRRDTIVDLMGNLKLNVEADDSNNLKFYLMVLRT